jgi:fructose PTS system EIIBC or EIIC component
MLFGCQLRVPHGGIFVLPIPGVVSNLALYLLAIVIGTLVTTAALFLLKRPVTVREAKKAVPAAA